MPLWGVCPLYHGTIRFACWSVTTAALQPALDQVPSTRSGAQHSIRCPALDQVPNTRSSRQRSIRLWDPDQSIRIPGSGSVESDIKSKLEDFVVIIEEIQD